MKSLSKELHFQRGMQTSSRWIPIMTASFLLALGIYSVLTAPNVLKSTRTLPFTHIKPLQPPSNRSSYLYSDLEWRNTSLRKYQGAIRIPTEVYDTSNRPDIDITGWEPFLEFHEYLEESFPLVHAGLKVEKVNKLGLLITFEGTNSELKPLVFTAHQDVVPVDPDTLNRWRYEPFSAHFDGKYVWGRGAADTKSLFIAVLEVFEQLLEDEVQPKRTMVFAAAYDEETIGRYDGALSLSKILEERYGSKGVYALVDEGGSVTAISPGILLAAPSIAEKGYLDVYIELTVPGGHSSNPPDHTAIGIIGSLTTALENDPYASRISDENPLLFYLEALGRYSESLDSKTKYDFLHARSSRSARSRVEELLSSNKIFKYLYRTSQAIDLVEAGIKINALPEVLQLGINHRLAHGTTVNDILNKVISHCTILARQHDLGLSLFNGSILLDSTDFGAIEISWEQPIEPSPISSISGAAWDIFAGSIKHTFENIISPKLNRTVHLAPSVVGGYTDASRYWPLTDNVYRFIGAINDGGFEGKGNNAHAIDENLEFDAHIQAVVFLYDFILNVDYYES